MLSVAAAPAVWPSPAAVGPTTTPFGSFGVGMCSEARARGAAERLRSPLRADTAASPTAPASAIPITRPAAIPRLPSVVLTVPTKRRAAYGSGTQRPQVGALRATDLVDEPVGLRLGGVEPPPLPAG